MKKGLSTCMMFLFAGALQAQYCMLPGQTPYSPLQPGIKNFQLNTINRTSGNSESASAVVVVTGQSTTLTPGQTYTVMISHSEDTQFFAGAANNIRVWIDYNNNFSFTDPGETVISADFEPPGTTFTGTFTIPASVTPGTLTLRATAKMSSDAGHTIPTPCNVPADPLGYHGEMEDYLIIIEGDQGVAPVADFAASASNMCVSETLTLTNASTGTPMPTYSWSAVPAAGVNFVPGATAADPTVTFNNAGTYSIFCVASNSVSDNSASRTVTVDLCSTTGEQELNGPSALQVWPNPASDQLYVKLPDVVVSGRIRIIDMTGRVVVEKSFSDKKGGVENCQLKELRAGYYFLELVSDDSISRAPFILLSP